MRERTVETYLAERVKATGGEVRKVEWIGRSHAPDRYAWWPVTPPWEMFEGSRPRAVWVELKRPGKDARSGQAREHERMRKSGLDVRVVDTFAKVDSVIAHYGMEPQEKKPYDREQRQRAERERPAPAGPATGTQQS